MNNDEVRKLIAEKCGWTNLKWRGNHIPKPDRLWGSRGGVTRRVPNFPEDLNACAEMRKCVPVDKRDEYGSIIAVVRGQSIKRFWDVADATAAQHSETFLRIFDLWTE